MAKTDESHFIPKTLPDFQKHFPNNETCIAHRFGGQPDRHCNFHCSAGLDPSSIFIMVLKLLWIPAFAGMTLRMNQRQEYQCVKKTLDSSIKDMVKLGCENIRLFFPGHQFLYLSTKLSIFCFSGSEISLK